MNLRAAIGELQQRLDAAAVETTREWWQAYLRGAIPFRGVGIPEIRKILAAWREQTGLSRRAESAQLEVALALFAEPVAEDKLAGILFLELYLQDRLPWRSLFDAYESLYARELIFDWNTCDWFCVRVLGPTLTREGTPCAEVLCRWSEAEHLWQARSGVVPFIKVAADAGFYRQIDRVCANLIRREERFAKTAVGWLLRDVSKHDRGFVERFLETHVASFSLESLRNATKYFEATEKARYVARVKAAGRS